MQTSKITQLPQEHISTIANNNVTERTQDELDLIVIFAFIMRNIKSIVLITALFGAIGILFALWAPKKYEFVTVIELGKIAQENSQRGIEYLQINPTQEILEILNIAIIPKVVDEYMNSTANANYFKIKAYATDKANIISIRSKGAKEAENLHADLHNKITQSLLVESNQYIDSLKAVRVANIRQSELRLAQKKNQRLHNIEIDNLKQTEIELKKQLHSVINQQIIINEKLAKIPEKLRWIKDREKLITSRLKEVTTSISNRTQQQTKAASGVTTTADAMTLMILDQQIHNLSSQRLDMEEELQIRLKEEEIAIKEEHIKLKNELNEYQEREAALNSKIKLAIDDIEKLNINKAHDISAQEQDLLKKKAIAEHIIPTKVILDTSPSIKPVSYGTIKITAASLFAGAFIAVFCVLFFELLKHARKHIAEHA